ncbi:restriction endonuclease subunit S [Bacillus sp. ISL-40]|uniref:restriction endonuclease subunit S n=1 Tax=Bacillus sp. ISL-40 TaxID=2819126 RepID=UPI001BE81C23|nr:restriction endonuclease subunit S [Bacillus sp. ISL-40]MBT2700255.1 restriction endonuclease subunit S [Bacillus sp. ISL-40]
MSKKTKEQKSIDDLVQEAIVPRLEYPHETPHNWIWTNLDTVSSLVVDGSHNPPPKEKTGFPMLSGRNILDGEMHFETDRYVSEENYKKEYKRTPVEPDDVLLTIVGTIGRTTVVPKGVLPFVLQRSVALIKPKINSNYLSYYFRSPYFQSFLQKNAKGTAQKGVYLKTLKSSDIPIPPLEEQERINEKVGSLLNKIDQAKHLITDAKETFELRRAAILDKAFRGELTTKWREENSNKNLVSSDEVNGERVSDENKKKSSFLLNESVPDTWKWVLSNQLFSFVTSGSRGWAKYYNDEGDLFIRVGNLSHESIEIDLTDQQKVSPPAGTEGVRTLVQDGDILVSITADVGRIAVVPKNFPKAYINQHVALARPSGGYFFEYVAWYLSSRNGGRLQFDRLQRGATKAGLGLNDIKNVWVPLPPLEEQYEIVSKIKSAFKKSEFAEKSLAESLVLCEELKKSILDKALRGELGTNDANEESALELLKEILSEKVGR